MNRTLNFKIKALIKAVILLMILTLGPIISKAQDVDSNTVVKVGDVAPNFTFYTDKHKTANLADYKGKVILLDFWATWCVPCRRELPLIQKLWEKFQNNPQFVLFAFDRGEDWDKTTPFKTQNHYTFPMLPDKDRKIFDLYARSEIPRLYVIGKDGSIIYQVLGYDPEGINDLAIFLSKHLN